VASNVGGEVVGMHVTYSMEVHESWDVTDRVLKIEMLKAKLKAEEFNFGKIIGNCFCCG
jgi:hypothetical protein